MEMFKALAREIINEWYTAAVRRALADPDSGPAPAGDFNDLADRIAQALDAERAKEKVGNPACGGCGGPHPFDTTIPSVVWNRVVRAGNHPDYLCLTCIAGIFARAGESFTAELWSEDFKGLPVEFIVKESSR